jgi:hypothetical protein
MSRVFWQYRTSMEPHAAVQGPFPATHMQAWREQGYFKNQPVFCRRCAAPRDALEDQAPADKRAKVKSAAEELEDDFGVDDDDNNAPAAADIRGSAAAAAPLDTAEDWAPVQEVSFCDVFP